MGALESGIADIGEKCFGRFCGATPEVPYHVGQAMLVSI
jgi:hypothetical protein